MKEELSIQTVPSQNKEQLQDKIIHCADTIYLAQRQQDDSLDIIRKQLIDIINDVRTLNVDRNEFRRMLQEALETRGPRSVKISDNWVRKLIPEEYRYPEFERKDYAMRKKVKPVFEKHQQKEYETIVESKTTDELRQLQEENRALKKKIEELELWKEIHQLIFEVKGMLKVDNNYIPVKAKINGNSRSLESVELDHDRFKKDASQEYRNIRQREQELAETRSKK